MNEIDQMRWVTTLTIARLGIQGFGAELRARREAAQVSVRALAGMIDVRPDILTRIEKGTWVPDGDDASKIISWFEEDF